MTGLFWPITTLKKPRRLFFSEATQFFSGQGIFLRSTSRATLKMVAYASAVAYRKS
jgi:hypothetical protein